jgi:opacity protein-like surface antigen
MKWIKSTWGMGSKPMLAIVLALSFAAMPRMASSAEIIPAVGLTRAVEGSDEVSPYGSLGLRAEVFPKVNTEIGVAYRQESRFNDQLKIRQWPVTASLWFAPISALYAGAGVGWYHTTLDYDDDITTAQVDDDTTQEFGVHLGGGLKVPVANNAALDLNGRYVMMRDQENKLIPGDFDPDFWNTSLGIAFGF